MVNFYTDRDTGKSYAHSEDVTDTTFAEFLSDERSRGHDVVAGIAAAPDDSDDEPEWMDVSSKHSLPDFEDKLPRSTREELGRRLAS